MERVRLSRTSTDRVAISSTGGIAGTLVLAEVAYPGWHVRVDGTAAKPVTVRGVLRGLEVPSGWRRVVWTFTPPWYRLGRLLTLLAAGLRAVLAIANPGRRRIVTARLSKLR